MNSLRVSCGRERREIENLYNEKARISNLVTQFKNNNEEYNKIKQAAYQEVKSILTNSKLLLKVATLSIIEALRSNPELYNFVIHDNSNNITINYRSNYLSLMSGGQQQQSFNDTYTALILEEAEKLYNKLTTKMTNTLTSIAAVVIRTSSIPLPVTNNKQNDTYQIGDPRYNNQS